MEKTWSTFLLKKLDVNNKALIDAGYRTGWSEWKRTPKEGDDGWAQYYALNGNNDEKQLSQDEWAPLQKALGKSQRAISKMMDGSELLLARPLQISGWRTIYAGSSIKPGDKMYFHYMTQKMKNLKILN